MKEVLQKFLISNKYISIYTNNNMESFLYGKLLSLNDSEFALMLISCDGNFDGILVKKINDIARVEFGGQYEKKMSRLISPDINEYCCSIDNNYITRAVLFLAKNNENIVSVELLDSERVNVMGFVEEIDDSICKIKQIDEYGYNDGYSYIYLNDITQVVCNSQDENRMYRLWKNINN